MKYMKKIVLSFLFILPFILGSIGYIVEGEGVLNAAYCSFALYAINPIHDGNNILIEIARWLAPAVVASSLIVLIKELAERIKDFFIYMKKDAFVLYGDASKTSIIKNNLNNAVIAKKNLVKDSDNHIIAFGNEENSFIFYNENQKELSGKNIFIVSDNIEMFRNDNENFKILNFSEIVARQYWVKHNLIQYFEDSDNSIEIAIIGSNSVAEKLLDYAILNNIYSFNQKITYHIFGDFNVYANIHSDLNLMNDDQIIFHTEKWENNINSISKVDRIVFAETPKIDLLMKIVDKCKNKDIHCYNLNDNFLQLLNNPNVISFGRESEAITKENIVITDIYYSAKCLNYKYACLYGEAEEDLNAERIELEWKKLDAFTKSSNICAANYHLIRRMVEKNIVCTDDDLAQMEHTRWCRFHFLNHWKYGGTKDGKKDSANRIHPCLVPFEELSTGDKQKDVDAINVLREVLG